MILRLRLNQTFGYFRSGMVLDLHWARFQKTHDGQDRDGQIPAGGEARLPYTWKLARRG